MHTFQRTQTSRFQDVNATNNTDSKVSAIQNTTRQYRNSLLSSANQFKLTIQLNDNVVFFLLKRWRDTTFKAYKWHFEQKEVCYDTERQQNKFN